MATLPPSRSCPYRPALGLRETEAAIWELKQHFAKTLTQKLGLIPVVAPRFVSADSGLQDNLGGTMSPVAFSAKALPDRPLQIVHSLAKWKRQALKTYGLLAHEGVLSDMIAIRKDEDLDPVHSLLVDQWDWEMKINPEDRTVEYLYATVNKIYDALLELEQFMHRKFPVLSPSLPPKITFWHSQQLADRWPELTPEEREQKAVEESGAIFVRGVGANLSTGSPHGIRSWDYDDYTTVGADGLQGLNGDIVVFDHTRGKALELSSMGIRVDAKSMRLQAEAAGVNAEALETPFHKAVLNGKLPSCMGGGIGQSRVAMLMLKKMHIGEVQASVWPHQLEKEATTTGFTLL